MVGMQTQPLWIPAPAKSRPLDAGATLSVDDVCLNLSPIFPRQLGCLRVLSSSLFQGTAYLIVLYALPFIFRQSTTVFSIFLCNFRA